VFNPTSVPQGIPRNTLGIHCQNTVGSNYRHCHALPRLLTQKTSIELGYCHELPNHCPNCHSFGGYRVGSNGSNGLKTRPDGHGDSNA
jgi:hypothetical protein